METVCSRCQVVPATVPYWRPVNCEACFSARRVAMEEANYRQIIAKWQAKGIDPESLSKAQVKARSKK